MRDLLDLVAEERDPVRGLEVRGLQLDDVALDAEPPAPEQRVVADVLDVDELPQEQVAVELLPHGEVDDPLLVLRRRADPVDARHGGDDDDVPPRHERGARRVAEAVDVVVPRGVLLDVEVGLRDVRLGLVVVVVRDEVLDGVLGEELAELVAELRRERLVVGDHERRPLQLLDQPRHRRRLARPRRPEERLAAVAVAERGGELRDRARLVARGAVGGGDAQVGHPRASVATGRTGVLSRPGAPPPAPSARRAGLRSALVRSRRGASRPSGRARRVPPLPGRPPSAARPAWTSASARSSRAPACASRSSDRVGQGDRLATEPERLRSGRPSTA